MYNLLIIIFNYQNISIIFAFQITTPDYSEECIASNHDKYICNTSNSYIKPSARNSFLTFWICRKVIEGGDLGDDDIRITKANRTYQVYRGMSPTTSNRLEVCAWKPTCTLCFLPTYQPPKGQYDVWYISPKIKGEFWYYLLNHDMISHCPWPP